MENMRIFFQDQMRFIVICCWISTSISSSFQFQFSKLNINILPFFVYFDHYFQESPDNPERDAHLVFGILCATFVFLPWIFAVYFVHKFITNFKQDSKNENLNSSRVSRWVTSYSIILFFFVPLSGSATSSIELANCRLFGLDCLPVPDRR